MTDRMKAALAAWDAPWSEFISREKIVTMGHEMAAAIAEHLSSEARSSSQAQNVRLREEVIAVLEQVMRMKTIPDDKLNTFTLVMVRKTIGALLTTLKDTSNEG